MSTEQKLEKEVLEVLEGSSLGWAFWALAWGIVLLSLSVVAAFNLAIYLGISKELILEIDGLRQKTIEGSWASGITMLSSGILAIMLINFARKEAEEYIEAQFEDEEEEDEPPNEL